MAKKLRYFELNGDEGYFLANDAMLDAAGLDTDDDLIQAFGGRGKRVTITLQPAVQRLQQEIVRQSGIEKPDGTFPALSFVRLSVMSAEWEEHRFAAGEQTASEKRDITERFYGDLHGLLAAAIDEAIRLYQFPQVTQNADFLKALQSKLKSSETAAN